MPAPHGTRAVNGTILLVEDNELNREMLLRRLSRAGLSVITAADGQEALDLMVSELPAWY